MGTINQVVTFFNDEIGRVLAGAKIYTYVAGDENTPKQTFSDEDLTNANPFPLVADARGIFPVLYGSGDYLLVYTDANDVEFLRRDNVPAGSDSIGTSAVVFNTVSDMVAGHSFDGSFVNLVEGTLCVTAGENNVRDYASSMFIIRAAGVTIDDFKYFTLSNGLVAERLNNIRAGRGVEVSDLDDAVEPNTYWFDVSTATNMPPVDQSNIVWENVGLQVYGDGTDIVQKASFSFGAIYTEFVRTSGNGTFSDGWYQTAGYPVDMALMPTNSFADLFSAINPVYGYFDPFGTTTGLPLSTTSAYLRVPQSPSVLGWSADDYVVSDTSSVHYYTMKDRQVFSMYDAAGVIIRQSSANSNKSLPNAVKTGVGVYEITLTGFTTFNKVNGVQATAAGTTPRMISAELDLFSKVIVRIFDAAGASVDDKFNLNISWNF